MARPIFFVFVVVSVTFHVGANIDDEIEELILLSNVYNRTGTNPTHYGDPSGGCMDDEVAAKIEGADGDTHMCIPKCDEPHTLWGPLRGLHGRRGCGENR